ncbi:Multiprotein-bridging factor 1 [Fusarium oxysporum f. sp. albedinis]|nr:Multiprotein-bridging factor 1 [Fusarium oxysporum f. sp. albedinis]
MTSDWLCNAVSWQVKWHIPTPVIIEPKTLYLLDYRIFVLLHVNKASEASAHTYQLGSEPQCIGGMA